MKLNITEQAKLQAWITLENEFIRRGLSTKEESRERLTRLVKSHVLNKIRLQSGVSKA